jgi:hypothetical protein
MAQVVPIRHDTRTLGWVMLLALALLLALFVYGNIHIVRSPPAVHAGHGHDVHSMLRWVMLALVLLRAPRAGSASE